MNFIQYIDDTYSVKVKDVGNGGEAGYVVSGINTPFFILSFYIENKRVIGVDFANYDSLEMLSVVNDVSNIDLNVIPLNHFAPAYTEIGLYVPYVQAVQNEVEISNWDEMLVRRYLKKYKLPQWRGDDRFMSGTGYSFDPNVYSLLVLDGVQNALTYTISHHTAYKNATDLAYPLLEGQTPNYINESYAPTLYWAVQPNDSIIQYGDFYVKMHKNGETYPYGMSVYIFSDIRTNEFWIYTRYLNAQSQVIKRKANSQTLKAVAGGFSILDDENEIRITITNVYG